MGHDSETCQGGEHQLCSSMAGIDAISCQHLQVLMTQLLQKHWEWQEDECMARH